VKRKYKFYLQFHYYTYHLLPGQFETMCLKLEQKKLVTRCQFADVTEQ